ncbi:unnamed protein product [Meganyctiphanes norvegica]|uniref:G-protein coupled receptors family 1 profile domain-containing protein n=1 Tax=Meganyctiphanes norvegica TaxID=48144 RepID=A0AAV2QUS5_MEGNR
MLIVVVILFLLCWGPHIMIEILINLGLQSFDQYFYFFNSFVGLLPFIHCCINPIIYCLMSKNFRRSMKRLVKQSCLWRRCFYYCCYKHERSPHIPLGSVGGFSNAIYTSQERTINQNVFAISSSHM